MTLKDEFDSISMAAIEEFVSSGRDEDLHLEFKVIGDPSLSRDDRRSLAAALSGFANADGGIIVWGVEARPNAEGVDCATALREIPQVQLCLGRLNALTGQVVSPAVDGVEHRALVRGGGTSGFCVTLVPPSSSGPHMAKAGEDRYFKRSGSSFYRMEHFDLEDVFGRRPKPRLRVVHRLFAGGRGSSSAGLEFGGALILGIQNDGRGLAHHTYLTLAVEAPYQVSDYGLDGNRRESMARLASIGGVIRYGAFPGGVVHPGVTEDVTRITIDIFQDNKGNLGRVSDLNVRYELAAQGVGLTSGEISIPSHELVACIVPSTV